MHSVPERGRRTWKPMLTTGVPHIVTFLAKEHSISSPYTERR